MRILIISDAWHPQINGVVRTYEHLSAHLSELGHDVKIIGPSSFKNFALPFYKEIDISIFPKRKLKREIQGYNPDHIHIAVEGTLGLAARSICEAEGRSYTTCYHSHFPDYVAKRVSWAGQNISNWLRNRVIDYVRWFHKNAQTVFVATASLEHTLRSWGFEMPMARLVRGVNTDIFYPPLKPVYNENPVLLYVGRVATEKNIEEFLKLDIDAQKIVVGGGPELDRFKKQYPQAHYAGYKTGSDLADYYRKADIFVFPSKTDTFGIVLIEALACGLPIAGYPVTGPKDIITDEYLGATDEDLLTAVNKALEIKRSTSDTRRVEHIAHYYRWDAIAQSFIDAITTENPPISSKNETARPSFSYAKN